MAQRIRIRNECRARHSEFDLPPYHSIVDCTIQIRNRGDPREVWEIGQIDFDKADDEVYDEGSLDPKHEMDMQKKLFIFDLGNVFMRTTYDKPFEVWGRYSGSPAAELVARFQLDEPFQRYERGEIDSSHYFEHISELMMLDITEDQIVEGWNAIFDGIHESVVESINRIRKLSRVVALSNTNRAHVNAAVPLYSKDFELFDELYFSCDIGMRKPEERIFRFVLEESGITPTEAVFFDDDLRNVDGARAVGIESVHVVDGTTVGRWVEDYLDRVSGSS